MSNHDAWDHSGKIEATALRAQGDHVLLEMADGAKKSAAGLILVGSQQSGEIAYGKVISSGGGIFAAEGPKIQTCVREGDVALIMDYAGERVYLADGKFRFVRDHGIWAKLDLDSEGRIVGCHPLQDKVLLKFAKEEKSLGGRIHLPSNPQTRFARATVVEVGPGLLNLKTGVRMPMSVKGGESVVASRYAGAVLKIKGEEFRIMQNMDLEAIFEGDVDVLASGGMSEAQDAGRARDEADGLKMANEGEAKLASDGARQGGYNGR